MHAPRSAELADLALKPQFAGNDIGKPARLGRRVLLPDPMPGIVVRIAVARAETELRRAPLVRVAQVDGHASDAVFLLSLIHI